MTLWSYLSIIRRFFGCTALTCRVCRNISYIAATSSRCRMSKRPELRTKERILALQERLVNAKTNGLMTLNVPVSYDLKTPIWQYDTKDRLRALEEGLKAALWAKENAKHPDLLYAGFEIGTYDDAMYIFNKASDVGLTRFAAGFGLFSRFIQFRNEDKLKQFEVLAAFNHVPKRAWRYRISRFRRKCAEHTRASRLRKRLFSRRLECGSCWSCIWLRFNRFRQINTSQ